MDNFIDFFRHLFQGNGFMPRWSCGRWTDAHGWLYILSNILIGIAYFTIPILLLIFIRRRTDIPFKKVLFLFSFFIIFCGTTHFLDALIFWFPLYRLNAVLLLITAIVSAFTAYACYKIMPVALNFKSPEQLHKIIDEQTAALVLTNQKLQASEQQFKALVNNNPDVIKLFDANLEYKFVNDSMTSLSEKKLEDFIGKKPKDLLPDHPYIYQFTKSLEQVKQYGLPLHYEMEKFSDKRGHGYFSVDMIPIDNKNEGALEILTITKDITEIRKNEQQLNLTIDTLEKLSKRLEFKNNTLQDFAYIVSHNLRSPTGNLLSLTEIYNRTQDLDKRDMLVLKIFEVIKQLSNTVQDLGEVVSINQNKEIKKEMLRFDDILNSQITSLTAQIMYSTANIIHDFSECETIYYPKVYLESIILNLLSNAIKYASPKRRPEIVFTTYKNENGLITLTCRDNGLGIDLIKNGSKLFSLHKTFHNRPDSRGVGLFITKNQIKSFGGNITVESKPDKGSTFIVNFNEIEYL